MIEQNTGLEMALPDIDESDVQAVAEVVRSGRLSLGPRLVEFEARFAEYCGVGHAVAMSSGTAALHVAVRALGIGPGDEVIVPSFTFAASVNAILYENATPVFVDIEPDTYNLSPAHVASRIGPRTRAILAVDVFGHPVDQTAIGRLAAAHRIPVIDDACEGLGATFDGRRLGTFGAAATFGFYPNKQLTTGEGGMLVTDDAQLAETARSLRNQGRSAMGAWLEHERMGYNYRLNEMSAALGLSQLRRIEAILAARSRVAELYTERLSRVDGLRVPIVRDGVGISWFVFVVTVNDEFDRDRLMGELARRGVPTRAYFSPVHLQRYVRERFGYRGGELPITEAVALKTLALPFHGRMTGADVDLVVRALEQSRDAASTRG